VRSSLRLGAGELTRLPSSSPLPAAPPPPLRRVRPELEAIRCGCGTGGECLLKLWVMLLNGRRDEGAWAAHTPCRTMWDFR
jgi:hypothetical protein